MEDREELKDVEIICKECGNTFVHNVKDQLFYKEMNFENMPKACPACRKAKKEVRNKRIRENSNVSFINSRNEDKFNETA